MAREDIKSTARQVDKDAPTISEVDGQLQIAFSGSPKRLFYADRASVWNRGTKGTALVFADTVPFTEQPTNIVSFTMGPSWYTQFEDTTRELWKSLQDARAEGKIIFPDEDYSVPRSGHDADKVYAGFLAAGALITYFGEYAEIQFFMYSPSALHKVSRGEEYDGDPTFSPWSVLLPTPALYRLLEEIYPLEATDE